MENPEVKELVKSKKELNDMIAIMTFALGAFCILVGISSGVMLAVMAPIIAIACFAFAGNITLAYEIEIDKIHKMMIAADCSCATYCT